MASKLSVWLPGRSLAVRHKAVKQAVERAVKEGLELTYSLDAREKTRLIALEEVVLKLGPTNGGHTRSGEAPRDKK